MDQKVLACQMERMVVVVGSSERPGNSTKRCVVVMMAFFPLSWGSGTLTFG